MKHTDGLRIIVWIICHVFLTESQHDTITCLKPAGQYWGMAGPVTCSDLFNNVNHETEFTKVPFMVQNFPHNHSISIGIRFFIKRLFIYNFRCQPNWVIHFRVWWIKNKMGHTKVCDFGTHWGTGVMKCQSAFATSNAILKCNLHLCGWINKFM